MKYEMEFVPSFLLCLFWAKGTLIMKLYNIKLRVISVQYSSLTIKSTPHLLINIVNRDYPLYEIESGLNHMKRIGEKYCLEKIFYLFSI